MYERTRESIHADWRIEMLLLANACGDLADRLEDINWHKDCAAIRAIQKRASDSANFYKAKGA